MSVGIQSILAFEVGYYEKALEYARYSVLMDLYDVGGNVADGCHIASMGATWMILVNGFAGLRDYDGQISFNPQRLEGQLKFPLQVRGRMLEVDILRDKVTYTLKEGENLTIFHENEEVVLTKATPRVVRDVADKRA